ncbi:MAG: trypsin-like peptidase domain-containing protein, partial [Patescibacteria group bacterium]
MRKNFLVVGLLAVVIFWISISNLEKTAPLKIKSPQEIYSLVEKAGVIIKNRYSNCSGVIVQDKSYYPEPFILSAGHCVNMPISKNGSFTACFNQPVTPVEIIPIIIDLPGLQGGLDFMAFRFKNPKIAEDFNDVALTLGSSANLKMGESVFLLAVHRNQFFCFSRGEIFSLTATADSYYRPQTILITSTFGGGSSGGLTVNNRGEVIGLNNTIISDIIFDSDGNQKESMPAIFGIVPIDDIKEDLALLTPYFPDKLLIVAHPLAIQIGFINSWEYTDQDLALWNIKRPSKDGVLVGGFVNLLIPAALVLHPGDKIISCEGKPVKTRMDAYRAIFFCYKKSISVIIERDGSQQEVTFELINPNWN